MFRVMPFSRLVIAVLWRAAAVFMYKAGIALLTVEIFVAAGVYVQYHLARLRLYFEKGVMIKKRGSFFNRRQVFVLKNICSLQTLILSDVLPGIMVLVYPGEKFFIFGFCGRQISAIEKYIKKNI